eukprot:GHVU01110856.1.p1 GENE.GHVU01110856.1~~GHVU01110856.1.p1  ORF type:complete len:404 (+),score=67.81 GHVU01110856.1:1897-3108(+)
MNAALRVLNQNAITLYRRTGLTGPSLHKARWHQVGRACAFFTVNRVAILSFFEWLEGRRGPTDEPVPVLDHEWWVQASVRDMFSNTIYDTMCSLKRKGITVKEAVAAVTSLKDTLAGAFHLTIRGDGSEACREDRMRVGPDLQSAGGQRTYKGPVEARHWLLGDALTRLCPLVSALKGSGLLTDADISSAYKEAAALYVFTVHDLVVTLLEEERHLDGPGLMGLPVTPLDFFDQDPASASQLFAARSQQLMLVFPEATADGIMRDLKLEFDRLKENIHRMGRDAVAVSAKETPPLRSWTMFPGFPSLRALGCLCACVIPGTERLESEFGVVKETLHRKPHLQWFALEARMHVRQLKALEGLLERVDADTAASVVAANSGTTAWEKDAAPNRTSRRNLLRGGVT